MLGVAARAVVRCVVALLEIDADDDHGLDEIEMLAAHLLRRGSSRTLLFLWAASLTKVLCVYALDILLPGSSELCCCHCRLIIKDESMS